jgi:hypothetical protein
MSEQTEVSIEIVSGLNITWEDILSEQSQECQIKMARCLTRITNTINSMGTECAGLVKKRHAFDYHV